MSRFAAKAASNAQFPLARDSSQQSRACCASALLLGTNMCRYSSAPVESV